MTKVQSQGVAFSQFQPGVAYKSVTCTKACISVAIFRSLNQSIQNYCQETSTGAIAYWNIFSNLAGLSRFL